MTHLPLLETDPSTKHEEMQNVIYSLQKVNNNQKKKITSLRSEITALQDENQELHGTIASLEKKLSQVRKLISTSYGLSDSSLGRLWLAGIAYSSELAPNTKEIVSA